MYINPQSLEENVLWGPPRSVMKVLSLLVVVSSLTSSLTEAASFSLTKPATDRKQLFDSIVNNDIDTMSKFGSEEFLKPFDDHVDQSGLRRYPVLLAIQHGRFNLADQIVSIIKRTGCEDDLRVLSGADALGRNMADYAATYAIHFVRKYVSTMIAYAGIDTFKDPSAIERFVNLAFHNATGTAAIILDAVNSVHDPELQQLILRRTMNTYLERANIGKNTIFDSFERFALAIRDSKPELFEELMTRIVSLDRSTILRFVIRIVSDLKLRKFFDLAVANRSVMCLLVLIEKRAIVLDVCTEGPDTECTDVFDYLVKAVQMKARSLEPSRRDLNKVNLMYFALFGAVSVVKAFASHEICLLPKGGSLTVELAAFMFSLVLNQDELSSLLCFASSDSCVFNYLFDFIFGDIEGLPVSEALKASVLGRLLPILNAHSGENQNFELPNVFQAAVKYPGVSADLLMILARFFPNENCEKLIGYAIDYKLPLVTLLEFIRQIDARVYNKSWFSQKGYTKLLIRIIQDTVDLTSQHREILYGLLKNNMSRWAVIKKPLVNAMSDLIAIFSEEEMGALQVLLRSHQSGRP